MKVYGNGSVVKKGNGYLLRVVIGYDKDGKPIRKSKGVKTHSKREAEKLLFIKAALKQAVKRRWIPYNPATDANPFRSERPEVAILSEDETRHFIRRVLDYPRTNQATAMLICVCCGTRRGEVCSLTWRDIDLEAKVIHLRQAVTEVSKGSGSRGALHFNDPKTTTG